MGATGIQLFSWELFWAGALGAALLDMSRWAVRIQTGRFPEYPKRHAVASCILVLIGGGTSGLFGGAISGAWLAAAIGAGAPAVLRTMATIAPSLVRQVIGFKDIRSSPGAQSKQLEEGSEAVLSPGSDRQRSREEDREQVGSTVSSLPGTSPDDHLTESSHPRRIKLRDARERRSPIEEEDSGEYRGAPHPRSTMPTWLRPLAW